ncbi:MAG: DUF4783 domain-containing protein [Ignavibacteriae bacterium]|nr:DUF4783 domain-containing protein [Ignavibacteria bacterium]MBI3364282.1 DUF4783 domain-containing protein [Ignavibacteriota bacterium]
MRRLSIILLYWVLSQESLPAQDVEEASLFAMNGNTASQQDSVRDVSYSNDSLLTLLVEKVHQGIASGNVQMFSEHFARQVSITLRGKEGGYFSGNQAFYILQSFFSSRRVLNFKFTTVGTDDTNSYATGGGVFMVKGNPEVFQVYVALASVGDRWVVTQFNVY